MVLLLPQAARHLVGLVEEGMTLDSPQTAMMSGACPPPAPSLWYVWMVRPLNAATDPSRLQDSFSVSVWMVTYHADQGDEQAKASAVQ